MKQCLVSWWIDHVSGPWNRHEDVVTVDLVEHQMLWVRWGDFGGGSDSPGERFEKLHYHVFDGGLVGMPLLARAAAVSANRACPFARGDLDGRE